MTTTPRLTRRAAIRWAFTATLAAAGGLATACTGGTTAAVSTVSTSHPPPSPTAHPAKPAPAPSTPPSASRPTPEPSAPDEPSVDVKVGPGSVDVGRGSVHVGPGSINIGGLNGVSGDIGTTVSGDRIQLDVGGGTGDSVLGGEPGAKVTLEMHNSGQSAVTVTMDGVRPDKTLQPGATDTEGITYPDSGILHVHYR